MRTHKNLPDHLLPYTLNNKSTLEYMGNQQGSPASIHQQQKLAAPVSTSSSPRRIRDNKARVMELESQIQEMKVLKADNEKGFHERIDAMAKDNVEKSDARKAQYLAEVDAQRHRNEESRADNDQKIHELNAANQSELAAMRDANQAEMDAAREKNAQGTAAHEACRGAASQILYNRVI